MVRIKHNTHLHRENQYFSQFNFVFLNTDDNEYGDIVQFEGHENVPPPQIIAPTTQALVNNCNRSSSFGGIQKPLSSGNIADSKRQHHQNQQAVPLLGQLVQNHSMNAAATNMSSNFISGQVSSLKMTYDKIALTTSSAQS